MAERCKMSIRKDDQMQTVRFERQGGVGRIVLANPPYNRLDGNFARGLQDSVREAGASDIRVLILSADGPNFSMGGGTKEVVNLSVNEFRTRVTAFNNSFRAIEGLRVPTVAAVCGMAWGGGFELALSCDFIVVSASATFKCVEVDTAMIPIAGGIQRLCERVGRSRASRYAMLGEPISGEEALRHGIATHLVPDAELETQARALVERLADGPTRSYAATRTLLKAWSGGGVPLADAVMLDIAMDLFDTDDCKRGFLNKSTAYEEGKLPPPIVFNGR
jgi:enoyl-CoA hydratase/carnithine racemase